MAICSQRYFLIFKRYICIFWKLLIVFDFKRNENMSIILIPIIFWIYKRLSLNFFNLNWFRFIIWTIFQKCKFIYITNGNRISSLQIYFLLNQLLLTFIFIDLFLWKSFLQSRPNFIRLINANLRTFWLIIHRKCFCKLLINVKSWSIIFRLSKLI